MKKICKLLLVLMVALSLFGISVSAEEEVLTKTGSTTPVTFIDTGEVVTIPTEYNAKDTDFRAVWISPYLGEVATYQNKEQYQKEFASVFEVMEHYNLNVMIFHVRIMNDALYTTSLSPISRYWKTDTSWDALEWIIDECHKRGIEFHAWMNPYRVQNYTGSINLNDVVSKFPRQNPASSLDNLLVGSSTVILNPAKAAVKNFLVSCCMEVVEKYDVDAIHFDDYFYAEGIGTQDNSDYLATGAMFNSIADWRREQVDNFIRRLSIQLTRYNNENNKTVQLGISPSGVYRDGNGVVTYDENGNAITTGSLTRQGGHYGDHLYSDTLRWINEEWIDYILPQCYHGFEVDSTSFHGEVDWWNKVVANKSVNLYIGVGLYQANNGYWLNEKELYNEMYYMSKMENVQGLAFFSFRQLKAAYESSDNAYYKQLESVIDPCFNSVSLLPVLERFESIVLDEVNNLGIKKVENGYEIRFDKLNDAKFYAIYKTDQNELKFTNDELIAVISSKEEMVSYIDISEAKEYLYGVKALSKNNTLGKEALVLSTDVYHEVTFVDRNDEVLAVKYIKDGVNVSDIKFDILLDGYTFLNWIGESVITSDTVLKANVESLNPEYKVTFLDFYGEVMSDVFVKEGESLTEPDYPTIEGYNFVGLDNMLENITEDLIVRPIYEKQEFVVTFKDGDTILYEEKVKFQESATYVASDKEGYQFVGWSKDISSVEENMVVDALYDVATFTLTYIDEEGNVIDTFIHDYGDVVSFIDPPVRENSDFLGFFIDGKETAMDIEMNKDITVVLKYGKISEASSGCNSLSNLYSIGVLVTLCWFFRRRKF